MTLFVWDYHGTLEKGNERAVLELSNMALAQEGHSERFTQEHLHALYGKRWLQWFEALLPNTGAEVHAELQRVVLEIDKTHPDIRRRYIRPNDNSHAVLDYLGRAHEQIVISNCHDIGFFLRLTEMEVQFPTWRRFATAATTPAKSKQQLFDDYLNGKKPERIVLIGDSPEDLSLRPADVTYIYAHPGLPFRECDATYKTHTLLDVLREF